MEKQGRSALARRQCEHTAAIYYAFRRKRDTANDMIEIPAMKKLIGHVRGKSVLDAGCGFGTYSIYCARRGAAVTAVDISETMIRLAKKEAKEAGVRVDFRAGDATNLKGIPSGSFDLAVSSIAVCFDLPRFFREMARILREGGVFCFSDVHPLVDGGKRVGEGREAAWLVDGYFDRGVRKAKNVFGKIAPSDEDYEWRWEHSTLEDYSTALRRAGFLIETLLEPRPAPATRSLNPKRYEQARRYPYFVLIRAVKVPRSWRKRR